jgi:hypothetical protein
VTPAAAVPLALPRQQDGVAEGGLKEAVVLGESGGVEVVASEDRRTWVRRL